MYSFMGHNLDSMQALSHACLPLLDFLGQIIHFWMTNVKDGLVVIFSSIIPYWHTFEIACPKQVPLNGSNKKKILHDTKEIKALAHACK